MTGSVIEFCRINNIREDDENLPAILYCALVGGGCRIRKIKDKIVAVI